MSSFVSRPAGGMHRRSFLQLAAALTVLSVIVLLTSACTPAPAPLSDGGNATPRATSPTPSIQVAQPMGIAKYVFLFIGDGMAPAQRTSAELYLAATASPGSRPETTKLNMNQLPIQGMNTTYDLTSVIPDSASTGTAIATGYKTKSGVVSMDGAGTVRYETITEVAKARGMKVGIVSAVSIDHATPAVFYAHVPSRSNMYDIAIQLGKSNFDYFGGGGLVKPKGDKGDQPDAVEAARANGYTVVTTRADFDKLAPGSGKVLAMNATLDPDKALPYELDRAQDDLSIVDYTKKGIELLKNPNGFFMMVEGGKIDWAAHANDAAASIRDTLALDTAVGEALKFYAEHPRETLIIVTGDHETGGMTIGFAGTQYDAFFDKIQYQKASFLGFNKQLDQYKKDHTSENARFEDVVPMIRENFGLSVLPDDERAKLEAKAKKDKDPVAHKQLGMTLTDFEVRQLRDAFAETMKDVKVRAKDDYTYLLYGGYEPLTVKLTTLLNQKAGIGWTSYSHTGVPVQTSAIGVGAELFGGFYDQPEIYKKMVSATGLR